MVLERVSFEVLPERIEIERLETALDRLCVLAEAAYDLDLVDPYRIIEEEAETLALRLRRLRAA
jgi:hypothetical protein